MGKRGASQIDWIISLSLFLMYVAWFFVFIRPNINLGVNRDTLITILEKGFEDDFSWELKKYPLFVEYNASGGRKPLMLDYDLNITDLYFTDDLSYTIWGGKLFLIANLSEGMNTFWIVEGINKTSEPYYEGLNIEEDRAATENLTVYFYNSMPDALLYKGRSFIESVSYKINDYSFAPANEGYTDMKFAAFYTAGSENINHTSIVFSHSPELNNFLLFEQEADYMMQIDMELYDFDSYYSDNSHFGNFEYEEEANSLSYSFDYITLTGNEGSLSMYFDSEASFNFTYYNSTLDAKILAPICNNYNYRLAFHDGNYTEASRIIYSSEFGSMDYLRGINLQNLSANYTHLKKKWGFPNDMDFQILLYDNSTAFHYLQPEPIYILGDSSQVKGNVYAEAQDITALDDEGNYNAISIIYRIW